MRAWSGSHGCAGTQDSSPHRGRSVPGDAESSSLWWARSRARAFGRCLRRGAWTWGRLPAIARSQWKDRVPASSVGRAPRQPAVQRAIAKLCAMDGATPGQVSTATPHRRIKLPGADAKREVRSRYDRQVAHGEPYAKSRDLATVCQAIAASRCRNLAGIVPLSTSASFATVPAERSPRRVASRHP